MVLFQTPVNTPPPHSNQTPISPQNPLATLQRHIYQGIPQHITRYIPPGPGPDSYGRKMSYGIDAGSVVGGIIIGFILGGIVFTTTGRQFAGAAGRRIQTEASYLAGRAASAIEPKNR